VLVFRVKLPKDGNGNPITECAGGLTADGHFVGPLVFFQIFGNHGEEESTVAFYNAGP
jgi:hypothetical protein